MAAALPGVGGGDIAGPGQAEAGAELALCGPLGLSNFGSHCHLGASSDIAQPSPAGEILDGSVVSMLHV